MKKSHVLILAILLIAVTTACTKNDTEVVPTVQVPKMKTLLSLQWKLTGYYYQDSTFSGGYPIIATLDYFEMNYECLRNSPVVFNADNTGTITQTCYEYIPEVPTRWHFETDSVGFYFWWGNYNLTNKYDYKIASFTADKIVLEQADTIEDGTTHYMKWILELTKN